MDIYEQFRQNYGPTSMVGNVTADPNSWFSGANVFLPGFTETLEDQIYDIQSVPNTAVTSRLFFQEPQGGPNNRTLADTNMRLNGTLPAGEAFLVIAVGVEYYPGVKPVGTTQNDFINDLWDFYTSGYATFRINNVPYVQQASLLQLFPENQFESAANFFVNQSTPADAVVSQQSAKISGRPFTIIPKLIQSSTSFVGEVGGIPVRTNAGRVGFRLYGYRARNAQG